MVTDLCKDSSENNVNLPVTIQHFHMDALTVDLFPQPVVTEEWILEKSVTMEEKTLQLRMPSVAQIAAYHVVEMVFSIPSKNVMMEIDLAGTAAAENAENQGIHLLQEKQLPLHQQG